MSDGGPIGKARTERAQRLPLCDLTRQAEQLEDDLLSAAHRVLASGRYILGPESDAFCRDMAGYLGMGHAIGVASGTDALYLALSAAGVGPGDRVATSPFTFFATAGAILRTGAEPVFTDIDSATFNLDPEALELVLDGGSVAHRRLGVDPESIRAVVPVHLYGQMADMEALLPLAEAHDLFIIEDAAQSLGAEQRGRRAGTVGLAGGFSFFPSKNLGAAGDGGMVVTDSDFVAERIRLLRAHGASSRGVHAFIGTNSRLDELQAAILRVKLGHLDSWIGARRARAADYEVALGGMSCLELPRAVTERTHTYHQYTVRVPRGRDALRAYLLQQGIESCVYYQLPLHLQPALKRLGYRAGDMPRSEEAAQHVLSLPMFPEMERHEVERVGDVIGRFEAGITRSG